MLYPDFQRTLRNFQKSKVRELRAGGDIPQGPTPLPDRETQSLLNCNVPITEELSRQKLNLTYNTNTSHTPASPHPRFHTKTAGPEVHQSFPLLWSIFILQNG